MSAGSALLLPNLATERLSPSVCERLHHQESNERIVVHKLPDRHHLRRSLVERDKEEDGFYRVGWELYFPRFSTLSSGQAE
jgi:hypothetical protein